MGAAVVTAGVAYVSLYRVDSQEMTASFDMLASNLEGSATDLWNGYNGELTGIGNTITSTVIQAPLTVDQWETISDRTNTPEFVAFCPLVNETSALTVQPKYPFQYMTPFNEKIANMDANLFPELKPLIETAIKSETLIVGQISKRLASSLFRQDVSDLDTERSLMVQPV